MKRLIKQARLSFRDRYIIYTAREYVLLEILYPLLNLSFYVVLASFAFQTSNLKDWVIGNSFLLCTNTCIFTLGTAFTAERMGKRLNNILASPANRIMFILEKALFPYLTSIIVVFIGFFIGSYVFSVDFSDLNILWFFLTITCGMISMTGFSVFISSLGLITDSMHFLLNLVSYILMIMSGANFPITQLPLIFQKISNIVPLKRSIASARMVYGVFDRKEIINMLYQEIAIGLTFFILSILLLNICEKISKKWGKLDFD